MLPDRTFCSLQSREEDEPRLATASRGTVWLLLEHPGPWGLQPPHDTSLPDPTKRHLLHLLETIPESRLLLIKHERNASPLLSFFVAVARERDPSLYAFTLAAYDELQNIDVAELAQTLPPHSSRAVNELFLVCTDGKHDYCCAKYGLPIYQKMKSCVGDAVWQASHVGGDRFAANVVCFPQGLFYGHVGKEDVEPLVDGYRGGNVYLPKYRGRSCYPFVVQAAEYFVRIEAGSTGYNALELIRSTRVSEQTWDAEFRWLANGSLHRVTLRRELSGFAKYLSCKAVEAERVPQYQLLSYQMLG